MYTEEREEGGHYCMGYGEKDGCCVYEIVIFTGSNNSIRNVGNVVYAYLLKGS